MNTSVEKLGPSRVRMTVSVSAAEVDEAVDEAYKRLAKKIKVPGFRAGKAPKPVIDTHVGREAVIADAQDALLNESYGRALDAEGIRPIASPQIGELGLMEPGKDFEFVAEVDVRPELSLSSVEGLRIHVPPSKATDREIDAQVEHLRERFASLEPVEDRGVEANDFVLISFVGTLDGEEYEGNKVDRYLYEMNRGLMPEEFDAALLGTESGATVTATFPIPETSSEKSYVGKTASFEITVHEIKAKKLPEVDDEFAANVGGYDSVAEMREKLREQLDQSKAVGHGREVERSARAALAERLEGEVPETMVENTHSQMMRDFITGLETRGISMQEYFKATNGNLADLEEGIGEQARQAVTEELALEALFRRQGWAVTDEDIDAEISELAGSSDTDPAELRQKWAESGVLSVLREQIMHRRAVQWLLDPANVEVIETDDPELLAGTKGTKQAASKMTKKTPAKKAAKPALAETEPVAAHTQESLMEE